VTTVRLVLCDDVVDVATVLAQERASAQGSEIVHVEASATTPGELATLAGQLPMFAPSLRVLATGYEEHGTRELAALIGAIVEVPGPNEVVLVVVGDVGQQLRQRGGVAIIDRRRPRPEHRRQAVIEALAEAGIRADSEVVNLLVQVLGEEVSRAPGLAATLRSVVGEGGRVDVDALEAVAIEAGRRPPWELTDAIESGDPARALEALRSQLAAEMPAALLFAVIERRVLELFAVAGTGAREAAQVNAALSACGLRTKPDFGARALGTLASRLSIRRAGRLVALVAQAQRDARGDSVAPESAVLSLLVARLAAAMPAQPRSGAASRGAPSRARRLEPGSQPRRSPPSATARG